MLYDHSHDSVNNSTKKDGVDVFRHTSSLPMIGVGTVGGRMASRSSSETWYPTPFELSTASPASASSVALQATRLHIEYPLKLASDTCQVLAAGAHSGSHLLAPQETLPLQIN